MLSHSQILKNSAELRRLNDRINTTVRTRSSSPEDRANWEKACDEFHMRFDELSFPGGYEMFRRVTKDDPVAVDAAVMFLVADPYHYRSGYLKERLWRSLKHCTLTAQNKKRLENAALIYLDRQISREFWRMCNAMARLGGHDFGQRFLFVLKRKAPRRLYVHFTYLYLERISMQVQNCGAQFIAHGSNRNMARDNPTVKLAALGLR